VEQEFEARWEHWLDHASDWAAFFESLDRLEPLDLAEVTILAERMSAPTWLWIAVAVASYGSASAIAFRHRLGATFRTVGRRIRPAPPMFSTIIPKQLSDYPQISLIDSRDGGECGLEIHSAQYGFGDGVVDVKVLLEEAITRHGLDIVVNNTTMGGDPAPGAPKELVVDYTLDGRRKTVTRREHQRLRIADGIDVPPGVSCIPPAR
jgi:hypothetical protein